MKQADSMHKIRMTFYCWLSKGDAMAY